MILQEASANMRCRNRNIYLPVLRDQDSKQSAPEKNTLHYFFFLFRINDCGFHSCFDGVSPGFIAIFLFIYFSVNVFYYYLLLYGCSSQLLFGFLWGDGLIEAVDDFIMVDGVYIVKYLTDVLFNFSSI